MAFVQHYWPFLPIRLTSLRNCFLGTVNIDILYYCGAALLAIILFAILRGLHVNRTKSVAAAILTAYIFLVYAVTVFSRVPGTKLIFRPQLGWSYGVIARGGKSGRDMLSSVLLNCLLLTPLGFLLPIIFSRTSSFVVPLGTLMSFSIEAAQYIRRSGYCELDDIVHNTLSVLIGLALYWVIYYLPRRDRILRAEFRQRQRKRMLKRHKTAADKAAVDLFRNEAAEMTEEDYYIYTYI